MKKILRKIFLLTITINIIFIGQSVFAQTLKFAQLSDIHIQKTQAENENIKTPPELLLNEAIFNINLIKDIDFTLITGDLTDYPSVDLLKYGTNILNTLEKPWYIISGNHDKVFNGFIENSDYLKVIKAQNPNQQFDNSYYTFSPKRGFKFIALDGTNTKATSNGLMPKEQLEWLDNVLSNSKNDVVVIYTHFPLVEPIHKPWHLILNSEEVKNVLMKHKMPILYVAGHYHSTSLIQDGNILHVASPSLSYCQEYRIITIDKKRNKVIVKFEYIDSPLKGIKEYKSRHVGTEEDKNNIIEVKKRK